MDTPNETSPAAAAPEIATVGRVRRVYSGQEKAEYLALLEQSKMSPAEFGREIQLDHERDLANARQIDSLSTQLLFEAMKRSMLAVMGRRNERHDARVDRRAGQHCRGPRRVNRRGLRWTHEHRPLEALHQALRRAPRPKAICCQQHGGSVWSIDWPNELDRN